MVAFVLVQECVDAPNLSSAIGLSIQPMSKEVHGYWSGTLVGATTIEHSYSLLMILFPILIGLHSYG